MKQKNESGKGLLIKLIFPVIAIASLIAVFAASRTKDAENSLGSLFSSTYPSTVSTEFVEFIDTMPTHTQGWTSYDESYCKACHADEYDDWSESPHAHALESEAFLATLDHTVANLDDGTDTAVHCIACHSPHNAETFSFSTGQPARDTVANFSGINCFACHTILEFQSGLRFINNEYDYIASSESPDFCAGCHNPDQSLLSILGGREFREYRTPMGNPYEEFVRLYPDYQTSFTTCISCHGIEMETGTLHQWPEDKAALIRSAYTLEVLEVVQNTDSIESGVSIINKGAGHFFPTGDPGRMLTLNLALVDPDNGNEILGSATHQFGNVLIDDILYDERIPPGSERQFLIEIDLDSEDYRPNVYLEWELWYDFDPLFSGFLEDLGVETESVQVDGSDFVK